MLFCTSECLKTPVDLLKVYLHESDRVYRDKMVEEQDFQLFDKVQAETVKKFYEVRVFQSSAEEDKNGRTGREEGEIIRLPALCLDLDISGQHSEEKTKRWGWGARRGLDRILISVGWGSGCQGLCCQPSKLENILMVFSPLLLSLPSLALWHAHQS